MHMTQKELALLINKDVKTIRNWNKENPQLIRLIKQGLALDETIDKTRKHLEDLENIREKANR